MTRCYRHDCPNVIPDDHAGGYCESCLDAIEVAEMEVDIRYQAESAARVAVLSREYPAIPADYEDPGFDRWWEICP